MSTLPFFWKPCSPGAGHVEGEKLIVPTTGTDLGSYIEHISAQVLVACDESRIVEQSTSYALFATQRMVAHEGIRSSLFPN